MKGLKLEEAQRILKAAKLNYEIFWKAVTDPLRHLLVDLQDPRPGNMRSTVSPGSVIKLEVLEYVPKVKVPNVVGQIHWKEAVKLLKNAGLDKYLLHGYKVFQNIQQGVS